jgi:hypothetical protein
VSSPLDYKIQFWKQKQVSGINYENQEDGGQPYTFWSQIPAQRRKT